MSKIITRVASQFIMFSARKTILSLILTGVGLIVSSQFGMVRAQRVTEPTTGIRETYQQPIALTNAVVVIDANTIVEKATLVIKEGKIVAVGNEIEIPVGAKEVDCTGNWIYPGFIDAYHGVTVETKAPQNAYWNENVRPEVNVSANFTDETLPSEDLRAAGITTVLAVPDAGIVRGKSCVVATSGKSLDQSLIRDEVAHHIELTVRFGRRGNTPNSPMGAVAIARQAMLDAKWYADVHEKYSVQPNLPQPESDASLQALADSMDAKRPFMIESTNEQMAMRAGDFANEFELPMILRGSGREYLAIERIAAMGCPIIVPVNFPKAPDVSTPAAARSVNLRSLMHWELAPENPAKLAAAGIEFALTAEGLEKPEQLLSKVREAIDRGLSKEIALAALTKTPAEILGISHVAGDLRVGKFANFVVADGELFEEKTKLMSTWVTGQQFVLTKAKEVDWAEDWSISIMETDGKTKLAEFDEVELELDFEEKFKAVIDIERDGETNDEDTADASTEEGVEQGDASDADDDSEADDSANDEDEQSNDEENEEDAEKDDGDEIELEKASYSEGRLSGQFESKQLFGDTLGTAQFSATLLKKEDDSQQLIGSIILADGTMYLVQGSPVVEDEIDDDEEADASESSEEESSKDDKEKVILSTANYPLGAYGRTAEPEQVEWLFIKNATIWTCSDEGIIENGQLLVHNGKIESVGTEIEVPDGCQIFDADGMHVSPGIIDCHTHMATDGGVNESSQAVTAEVRIGDFIDANDITIYRHLAGGVTTANVLHGSANPIGGQNQVIKLRWGQTYYDLKFDSAPAGVKFALGENVKQSNWPQPTGRYPQTRMGVEQIYRDRFEAAKDYMRDWEKYTETRQGLPPRRDLELDAVAEILRGERWIHCHSYRQDEILAFLRVLEDYDVTIGSLQHILEGYKVAEAMKAHGAMASSFSDWWAYKFEVFDAIPYNGALMHEMGIVVSFNSDDAELARHLNHEAAKAIKYGGVSPEEALKFVTLNPAKQLRIEQYVGSLEPGKDADFVLWSRSPLSTMSRCEQTWIDGRKYFDRSEDLLRQKSDTRLHQQLVQKIINGGVPMADDGEEEIDPQELWPRHDEFCHHKGHDHDHDHE